MMISYVNYIIKLSELKSDNLKYVMIKKCAFKYYNTIMDKLDELY